MDRAVARPTRRTRRDPHAGWWPLSPFRPPAGAFWKLINRSEGLLSSRTASSDGAARWLIQHHEISAAAPRAAQTAFQARQRETSTARTHQRLHVQLLAVRAFTARL